MQIKIGNRKLIDITKEEVYELLVVSGLFVMEHTIGGETFCHWHSPEITLFEADEKDNDIYFEWHVRRISDDFIRPYKSRIDLNKFYTFYEKVWNNNSNIKPFSFPMFNWLIEKGFNLPFSSYSN